ncbi:MAG: hypothetical protein M3466_06325, partial [Gemmatimonadota bacterium]|nr:hypothetical protein [Gemmatimonadota bacterium]
GNRAARGHAERATVMMTGIPMFQRVNAFVGVILMCPAFLSAQTMRLMGQSNLGGGGLNGDIAIVGTTAIVGLYVLEAPWGVTRLANQLSR